MSSNIDRPTRATKSRIAIPLGFWSRYGVPLAWLVLLVFFSLTSDVFLKSDNWINILRQTAVTGIAAIGATIVLISGGIDISQGATIAMAGVVTINTVEKGGWPDGLAIIAGMSVGLVVGLCNGLLVEKVRIPAFIATLGMMLIVRGGAFVYTLGRSTGLSSGNGETLKWIGKGFIGPLPVPVIIMLCLYLVAFIVMRETVWGLRAYAVGSDVNATRLAGVNTQRQRISVYIISGLLSAIAGVVLAGRLTSAAPGTATGIEFDILTAVVLGGTSIYGGRGNVLRTLLGAVFLVTVYNGMLLLNVPTFWQQVAQGFVLLGALALDQLQNRR